MNQQIIRQFRKTLRIFERLITAQLENCCCGVTLAQCHVLLEMEEQKQTTTSHLSEQFGLDKSTISRTLDGLVNIGLVERLPSSSDRRVTPLSLTKRGKEISEAINRSNDEYFHGVLKMIPEDKRERTIEHFSLLVQAYMKYEKQQQNQKECCTK